MEEVQSLSEVVVGAVAEAVCLHLLVAEDPHAPEVVDFLPHSLLHHLAEDLVHVEVDSTFLPDLHVVDAEAVKLSVLVSPDLLASKLLQSVLLPHCALLRRSVLHPHLHVHAIDLSHLLAVEDVDCLLDHLL